MEPSLYSVTEFFDAVPVWLNAGLMAIAGASAVTALTPTPRDDKVVSKMYRLIEILALNIGHATPKGPKSDQ